MPTIEPGSGHDRSEWLRKRSKRLHATDVAAILNLHPWLTSYEVWLEKRGEIDPFKGNEATRLGNLLEPAILDRAEEDLGTLRRDVVHVHDSGLIAATLDGFVLGTGEVVEVKTAGLMNSFADVSGWGEPDTDQVPETYLIQVQAQLLCSEADRAYLYGLIAGRGLVRYEIPRSDTVCKYIEETCSRWWDDHVEGGRPPVMERAVPLDVVKRIRRVPEKTVTLDQETSELLALRSAAKEAAKEANAKVEDIDARLIMQLGDAEAGVLPDGRQVTYFLQKRKGYTVAPQSFRVLREAKAPK